MPRPLMRLFGAYLVASTLAFATSPSHSEGWPDKAVRITTPFAPGISPDAAARFLSEALAKRWKQPVIVENRPGAETTLGTQAFLDGRDDNGLLFTTHSTFTVIPLLRAKLPYDPVADARPISLAVEDFLAVAASPTLDVRTLDEFVQLARKKPSELNFYAAPGSPYLAYLAFQKQAGISTTFVPYNSPVNAISDLSTGRIHVAVLPLAAVLGVAQAGKIRLIAITNDQRTPAAPDVPTAIESGYPHLTLGGYLGFFAPKQMPAEQRERIASDVQAVLQDPELQKRLSDVGMIARGTSPSEFATLMDAQRHKWAAIAREHGIEPQ